MTTTVASSTLPAVIPHSVQITFHQSHLSSSRGKSNQVQVGLFCVFNGSENDNNESLSVAESDRTTTYKIILQQQQDEQKSSSFAATMATTVQKQEYMSRIKAKALRTNMTTLPSQTLLLALVHARTKQQQQQQHQQHLINGPRTATNTTDRTACPEATAAAKTNNAQKRRLRQSCLPTIIFPILFLVSSII
jgi:hypothetical protein